MRLNLSSLDPASPLTLRIKAALGRDDAQRAQRNPAALRGIANTWHREDDLHRAIVGMIAVEAKPGVIAFHPANGGKRGKAEAGRLKGMGVVAGIPDLIVVADGKTFGLEIKTEAGRLSGAQKAMANRFRRAGCAYEVARSITGARQILRRWGAIAGQGNIT